MRSNYIEKFGLSSENEVQEHYGNTSQSIMDIEAGNAIEKSISTAEVNIAETPADVLIDIAINETESEYADNGILLDTKDALSVLRKRHLNQAP